MFYKQILFSCILIGLILSDWTGASQLTLSNYDGRFFDIKIPSGWQIYTAGQCSEFAFIVQDESNSLNQIFFYGSIGPVYMNPQQKQIDRNYMNMGGYSVNWLEMPVIDPLTPENFMSNFENIATTKLAQRFLPQTPALKNFSIITVTQKVPLISGGKTALMRALFTKDGKVGEGLFLCTVAPFMPYTGSPGAGNAYGFLVTGITAPHEYFARSLPILEKSISSFTINRNYANNCIRSSQGQFQQVIQVGQSLRETADMIITGWENRNQRSDIIAEKRSDAILDYERVYDPATNQTYQVNPEFWEKYKLNRRRYKMNNLQLIPNDNYDLWNQAPQNQKQIR